MNEIEEIKARIDVVDLVSQYVTLRKAGANYKGTCPFHSEKTASLMVSPQKQIWKCFGCGKGGSIFDFIMEAEHLDFADALRLLAQKAGVTLQSRTEVEHRSTDDKTRLYRINLLASRVFQKVLLESSQGRLALDYLKKRGLTDKTIKDFALGFASPQVNLRSVMAKNKVSFSELAKAGSPEKFYNRIIFPIYDVLGNIIAFTGRAMGEAQPKYLNSPETVLFSKSRTLYGLNFAKADIKDKDYVVLVEGQVDVIALHQAGFNQAVASSGTAITESQIRILSKYTNNFLLAFDNDSAGTGATKKVVEMLLKLDLNSKVVDFGSHKDAGELFEETPNNWPKLVKAAVEGLEWQLKKEVEAAGDIQFIENKKKVLKAMLPLLALITDQTRLDHYISRVALYTEAKPESVYQSLIALEKKETSTAEQPTAPTTQSLPHLTNEEQFLAIILNQPTILKDFISRFQEISWQSEATRSIALAIEKCYSKEANTKVTNQAQFLSLVKNQLDSQSGEKIESYSTTSVPLSEKLDSWQFWISTTWPDFSAELAHELAGEKLDSLRSKKYEKEKENLAAQIRLAQEKSDVETVKSLLTQLNNLTKQSTN